MGSGIRSLSVAPLRLVGQEHSPSLGANPAEPLAQPSNTPAPPIPIGAAHRHPPEGRHRTYLAIGLIVAEPVRS